MLKQPKMRVVSDKKKNSICVLPRGNALSSLTKHDLRKKLSKNATQNIVHKIVFKKLAVMRPQFAGKSENRSQLLREAKKQ
jgi:hypothetical protein